MPIEKNDRSTQWTLDLSDSEYVLARKATITVTEGYGIYESGNNNEIAVLGDISLSNTATAGVRFKGGTSSLEIGKDSEIDASAAQYGIFAEGAAQQIVNRGVITAGNSGIHGEIWGEVENFGTIDAPIGIHYLGMGSHIVNRGEIDSAYGIIAGAGGTSIVNERGATISGDVAAISFLGDGASNITNRGVLSAGVNAIQGGDGPMTVINSGRIIGNITLSDADDRFDTTKGEVKGTIRGGEGDDTYYISSTKTKIEDLGASYDDLVWSTASYKLVGGLDHLRLQGAGDINGTGNIGANIIGGNRGDNRLSGMDGNDLLGGGEGDDILIGGDGEDVFHFIRGGDVDRVQDFEDGIDLLQSEYVNNQSDFDALKIRVENGDLVIDFGHGDKLIVADLAKANLTYDDFSVT